MGGLESGCGQFIKLSEAIKVDGAEFRLVMVIDLKERRINADGNL